MKIRNDFRLKQTICNNFIVEKILFMKTGFIPVLNNLITGILKIVFLNLCIGFSVLMAQQPTDSVEKQKKEKIKKGWNFGILPVVGFNSDIGFQYGGLVDLYHYGDGSLYPKYFHSLYFEVSRTTKGGGINQFFYDSEKLIPGVRVTGDLTYLTEKALNFYGFNGYEAVYNPEWEDDSQGSATYKTRMFYRHERKLLRLGLDFTKELSLKHLYWLAGVGFFNTRTAPVDLEKLNKGLSGGDALPDVPGLYDEYVSWGIISQKETQPGFNTVLKLGIIYDSRDNEPNPNKGIWSEILVATAPKMMGDGNFGFAKLAITHRQYFPLLKNRLTLAYQLAYQGTIGGKVPFYLQPYMIKSFAKTTTIDGLGGARNIRGILRNRVVGDGVAYGNAELRYKFLKFRWINQNFYLAVNAFADAGMVVQKIDVDKSGIPAEIDKLEYFGESTDKPHVSLGGGLRVVMNENFIIAADYGVALDKRDGKSGTYIGFGYLF